MGRCLFFAGQLQLIPDDTPPLPGETVHNNRPIPAHTLFGTAIRSPRFGAGLHAQFVESAYTENGGDATGDQALIVKPADSRAIRT